MAGLLGGIAGGATVFALQALLSLNSDEFSRGLDDARGEANSAADVIANTFGITGAQIKRGLTIAAGALAGITALAVNSYSEYEQMVGGAELLFGDAYDTVAENASTAYRRVQMSQSAYLGEVNRYAVGLRNALGGDTQAAAELADRILVAQADIVAATGTSQEMVQNAFNGIMRGNFTMLDNLSLGIAGTREGMETVIEEVNAAHAAQNDGIQYTMDNYADMETALVEYVEMQGLAGYASMEAMDTIQGATAAAKSAWQDLLAALASGENVGQAIDNLMGVIFGDENGQGLLNQILPIIGNVLDGIGQFIGRAVPIIAPYIPRFIRQIIPSVISGVATIVAEIGRALPELVMAIWQGLVTAVEGIFEQYSGDNTIFGWLAEHGEAVATAIMAIVGAFIALKIIGTIIGLLQALGTVLNFLAANPIVLIIGLIAAVVVALITLWNTNEDFRNAVINIFTQIRDFFVTIFNFIKEHIIEPIKTAIHAVAQFIYDHFVQPTIERVEMMKEVFWAVVGFIRDRIIEPIKNILSAIVQFFIEHFVQPQIERVEMMKQVFWTVVGFIRDRIINPIKNIFTTVINWISEHIVEPIRRFVDTIKRIVGAIVGFFRGRAEESRRGYQEGDWEGAGSRVVNRLRDGMNRVKEALKSKITELAQGIIERWRERAERWREMGSNVINGIREGMERAKQAVINFIHRLTGDISHTAARDMDMHSPSRVMERLFENVPLGMARGISNKAYAVVDAMSDVIDDMMDEADGAAIDIPLGLDDDMYTDMTAEISSNEANIIDRMNERIDANFNALLGMLGTYFPQFANTRIVLDSGAVAGVVNRQLGLGY